MGLSPAENAELRELLDRLCEGSLEESSSSRLQSLATHDCDSRNSYVRYLQIHGDLQWICREQSLHAASANAGQSLSPAISERLARLDQLCLRSGVQLRDRNRTIGLLNAGLAIEQIVYYSWLEEELGIAGNVATSPVAASTSTTGTSSVVESERFKLRTHRSLIIALAVAASLLLVAMLAIFSANSGSSKESHFAVLTNAEKCQWDVPCLTGETIGGQLMKLTSGLAEFKFADGAVVVLESPAELEIKSSHTARLTRGRLTAHVPYEAIGFTVETPTARIVDLGTEFGVEVYPNAQTEVHVLRGAVKVMSCSGSAVASASKHLTAGKAVRSSDLDEMSDIPFDGHRFPTRLAIGRTTSESLATVWLSNLFDDAKGTPLAMALQTDKFKATPTSRTLGVYCVNYGGAPTITIAPRVRFDFENLGWSQIKSPHLIANDAWRALDLHGPAGGIRLSGSPMGLDGAKTEEGIGMHADALISFNLEEIRAAGHLKGQDLEFRCDRAGINDSAIAEEALGSVHLVVLVSTDSGISAGVIDGKPAEVNKQSGKWSVTSEIGKPLRVGSSVSFRLALKPEDKYLTLAATSAGDSFRLDNAVWIDARLEALH